MIPDCTVCVVIYGSTPYNNLIYNGQFNNCAAKIVFRINVVVNRNVWCGSSVMRRKPIKNAGLAEQHEKALHFTAVIWSSLSGVLFISVSHVFL
jgi:hypothetical protein